MTIKFLLPYLSERFPIMGMNAALETVNAENIIPIQRPVAPKLFEYKGSKGAIIP